MPTTEGPGPEFQSLAVPVDGSDFAEQALPLPTRIALATRARVRLLLVHRPPAVPLASGAERAYAALDRQVQEAEVAYLQRLARRVEDAGVARVESISPRKRRRSGPAASGSRRRWTGNPSSPMRSSTPRRGEVVRGASCPVLVWRSPVH